MFNHMKQAKSKAWKIIIFLFLVSCLNQPWNGSANADSQTGIASQTASQAGAAALSSNTFNRQSARPHKFSTGTNADTISFIENSGQIKSSMAESREQSISNKSKVRLTGPQKKNLASLMSQTANTGSALVRFSARNGTPRLIKGPRLSAGVAMNDSDMAFSRSAAVRFLADNRDLMKLSDPVQELSVKRQRMEKSGKKHFHYQQNYRGIPVWGKELSIHLNADDSVYYVQGHYEPTPGGLNTDPLISSYEAIEAVKGHLQITHEGISGPEHELVYYTHGDGTMTLAYKIDIQPALDQRWIYFIDAEDGDVIHRIHNIHSQVVTATGIDVHSVSQSFNAWHQGGTYYAVDPTIPIDDPPFDPINSPPNATGDTYIMSANNGDGDPLFYVSSTSQTSGWDASAVSAAYNTKIVYDYYKITHSRDSMDGKKMNLLVIVDFQTNYDNAFWDGTWMVYGGGGSVFSDLAGALDVAAHEMSHGVIENTANLIYENQSGALNESFADVFAAMVDRDDWTIGEDITLPPRDFLRDMANPANANGLSIQPTKLSEYQNLPNTEAGDWGGVHINSGIPNRAAYLLAEGPGTGIGRDKTEVIYYRALTTYLQASSQFIDAREALIQSAEDLYGASSAEVQAVKDAWDAVEVTEDSGTPGSQKPIPVDPVEGNDIMVYLFPTDLSHDDPFGSEMYSLYVQTFPSPFTGYDPDQDRLLPVTVAPHYTRPAVYTDVGGTTVYYVGVDFNLYSIKVDGSDLTQITTTGNIWSIALSPDGRFLSYTSTNKTDKNIYVVDLVCESDMIIPVIPSDYQDDGSESTNTVLYADSLSFDYTGNILVFDALNCNSFPGNLCSEDKGYRYWSIGFLDISDGSITSPFPNQNPALDFGYPSFAYNNNFIVTMAVLDSSDQTSIVSMVRTFNRETQEIADVANPNLGDNTIGVWGIPSFWGDDDYITIQQLDPGVSGKAFRVPIDNTWTGLEAIESLNDFDVAMPIMHRKAVRSTQGILHSNTSSLDFGSIANGKTLTKEFTLTNTGNDDIEIQCLDISGSTAFTTSDDSIILSGNDQSVLQITFSPDKMSGGQNAVLTLTNDLDNSTLKISLTGTVKSSKGGGGCFIATAAYGSYMADEVRILRDFRDKWLIPNSMGRAFVEFYYTFSPSVAEFIRGSEIMKYTTRTALAPAVYGVKYPAVSGLVLLAGLSAVLFFVIRSRRKRNLLVSLRIDERSRDTDNI